MSTEVRATGTTRSDKVGSESPPARVLVTAKDIYEVGEAPPLGEVPPRMHASLIRESRFGAPKDAFQIEVIDTPEIGPRQVLVYVMAAGTNYNNVWAALGTPVNVINARRRGGATEDFHIGGSDASGVEAALGSLDRDIAPIDDIRSTGRYRNLVARNLLRHYLT